MLTARAVPPQHASSREAVRGGRKDPESAQGSWPAGSPGGAAASREFRPLVPGWVCGEEEQGWRQERERFCLTPARQEALTEAVRGRAGRTRTATRRAVVPCTGAGRHGRPTLWLLISWPCSKALSSVHPQKGIVGQQTEARRQVQSAVKGQGQPDGGTDRMEARGLSHMQVSVCTDS